MKIVVLVKEVPDTYGERKLNHETGLAERQASEVVIDEICERALEVALRHADAVPDTEVVVLSLAPESATATVRKSLAMGAHSAVHVVDELLLGADLGLASEAIAAATRRIGFDLVIAGDASTDGTAGMLPAMLAEWLDVPHLTGLSSVDLAPDMVSGARPTETGVQTVSAVLPAVISVTEALPDGRFPNFKGIMASKKKPLETWNLEDLEVSAEHPEAARSIMLSVAEKPARQAGVKIIDEGDAGQQLATFLIDNRLA